ncbi:MAG: trypsin-like peptidase domain-containing protein, partial [Candidatus Binatia bacterium]
MLQLPDRNCVAGRRIPAVRFACLTFMAALLLGSGPGAAQQSPAARAPDVTRLTFLVEYIGSDYRNAVRAGEVFDQMEYGEILRFSRQAIEEYSAADRPGDEIARRLAALRDGITKRVDQREILETVRALLTAFATELPGVPTPATAPNLADGRVMFARDCATCHGISGGGDGPTSPGMDPPPTAFRGEYMNGLTPRHVFNTMTLGIEGTRMLSFAGTHSEQQRWDLAFYVMTLRDGFAPAPLALAATVGLAELATNSNEDLLATLRKEDPAATAASVDHLRANLPGGNALAGGAAESRSSGGVAAALQMQEVFADVAARVFPHVVGVSGYVPAPAPAPPGDGSKSGWQQGPADVPGHRQLRSGSGFLLGRDGDIATCAHLVRDEHGNTIGKVRVETHAGVQVDARVVGMEPSLDLAVVRIDDPAWTPPDSAIGFGDSDRL